MNKTLFTFLGFTSIASLCSTQAAIITWGPATAISTSATNFTDVSTNGTPIEAFNAQSFDHTPVSPVVNGVTFVGTTALLDGDPKNGGAADLSSATNIGDADYDSLLSQAEFGGGEFTTISVGNGNLESGRSYEIQIWFVDDRAAHTTRTMEYGDGLGSNVSLNDQFVIGTFNADATSQDLFLNTLSPDAGFGNTHITAYQIRLIPEPSTAALLGLGGLALILRRRN
ncbi:hypothetical protein NT6N_22240 [Oceaniferula spumae]|uniref:Ice-binding protein C-terminal domain-containing protein n=1 Tax=Oceaniferula spumae TaxID=2979115 RepID=A0AAT9FMJ8_9BACT